MSRAANTAALGSSAAGISAAGTAIILGSATDADPDQIARVALSAGILAGAAAAPAGLLTD